MGINDEISIYESRGESKIPVLHGDGEAAAGGFDILSAADVLAGTKLPATETQEVALPLVFMAKITDNRSSQFT